MVRVSIYLSNGSEGIESESISKGFRTDIYVKINKKIFNVRAYTLKRLEQDYNSELDWNGFFSIEPNLILVEDTSKEKIIFVINKLHEQGYFHELKNIEEIDIKKLFKIQ